ncbi:MAG: hypothetical protein FJ290_23225 [Planctomycetes bacterium]|nr:hypothetical protein [Planctomycetota bacterium]
MGYEGRDEARQDIVDAEYGSGHAGLGPSAGQVAFDLFFGLAMPVVLLAADPALFVADVADRAALPPYWAVPTYVVVGSLLTALLLWGITGMRSSLLGILLAGPFAAGALLFLVLGVRLLEFAVGHSDLLSGWVAFTPWFTAFVFVRHAVLACRAGAHRSVGLSALALVVSFSAIVGTLWGVAAARHRAALMLESQLLSDDPADLDHALTQIHSARQVDMDNVAEAYTQMEENDPRRPRVKAAYVRITGAPIEAALQRLFPRTSEALIPPPDAPQDEGDPSAKWVEQLFSMKLEEHEEAANELRTPNPDPRMLEAIVLRYSRLAEKDPRREWIENAYTGLNSEGETVHAALKRIQKKAAPKDKGPRPPAKAPKAPVPRKPLPSAPATDGDAP